MQQCGWWLSGRAEEGKVGGCVLIAGLEIAQCIGSIVDGTTSANLQLGTLDETHNCWHKRCYQIHVSLMFCRSCEQVEVDLVKVCFPHNTCSYKAATMPKSGCTYFRAWGVEGKIIPCTNGRKKGRIMSQWGVCANTRKHAWKFRCLTSFL